MLLALQRATHLVGRALERETVGLRIGQADAHVLAHLAEAGPQTIAALHRGFAHKRSTLTSILDRLEDRGFVRRALDRADRRSFRVSLTPRGRRVARRIAGAFARVEGRVAGRIAPGAARGFWTALDAIERSVR